MRDLTVEIHVKGEDGRFLTVPELEADQQLLKRLAINLDDDPAGGLSITDEVRLILVDDSLVDAVDFFLYRLPDLLRAGKGGTYQSHTGPEETSVSVSGDSAIVTGYDEDQLSTSVSILAEALIAARAQFTTLQRLVSEAAKAV